MLAKSEVDPARLPVFQAALTQAEELWEAASAVGAASRPLPLFYCLSQAGRAICAAWVLRPEWQPESHGLSTRSASLDALSVASLPVTVTKAKRGMFSMVAEATDSPVFEGSTSVAQLWASLPDLPPAPAVIGDALPPFFIESARPPKPAANTFLDFISPKYATIAYPQPKRLRAALGDFFTGESSGESIAEALAEYPAANGLCVEEVERPRWFSGNPEPSKETLLSFPNAEGKHRALYDVGDTIPRPAHESGRSQRYAIRPRIGRGNQNPPSQLMTLWALIYALSQLARYHPDAWVSALNPDTSEIAVDLEHGLDAALTLVAELLVPAVTSGLMPRLARESLRESDGETTFEPES